MNQKFGKNQFSRLWSNLSAKFYDAILFKIEQTFLQQKRAKLLKDITGHVLEIGAGTGVNFEFYTQDCIVDAIEPSPFMLAKATQKMANKPVRATIRLHNIGIEKLEEFIEIPKSGYDAIVCTLVLCTVPDLAGSITSLKKWLNKEGSIYLIEHVQAHNTTQARIFNWITPVWKRLAEGCHLNRPTDQLLKANGFKAVEEQYIPGKVPFYVAILKRK